MALCRCLPHRPYGRVHHYRYYCEPLCYPDTSSICGIQGCFQPGFIWLTEEENIQFLAGTRIFKYPNDASKVAVKNEPPIYSPENQF